MNPQFGSGGAIFPIIETIEDVLPAIEGWDDFVVAEREAGHTVINYRVANRHTFDVDPADCVNGSPAGLLRRECRGLIFDLDGKLISRPFHKFFNVGEREEIHPDLVAEALAEREHSVMDKMDGSMIRPLIVGPDRELRYATKMGLTDVSRQAEIMAPPTPDQDAWLRRLVEAGATPILEYISPENRIVVPYGKPELVLLAVRDNRSGEYLGLAALPESPFAVCAEHEPIAGGGFGKFMEDCAADEGREGFVIRMIDGNMLKAKSAWYVRIHKVKEQIAHDRHILNLILEGGMDDAVPHMIEEDRIYIEEYRSRFENNFESKAEELEGIAGKAWSGAEGDRKRLATETLPASGLDRRQWCFVFSWVDRGCEGMADLLREHVRKWISSNTRYLEVAKLLDLGEGRILETEPGDG